MILLDTSVLVYAVGAEHPLREPCRAVIAAVGDGTLAATTTVEVLQEFAHVRARRRGRDDAAALTERYATALAPLISVDADDLSAGLRLFREHEPLGAFDAVLAAVAQRRDHVRALVSADRGFASIPGLVHLDPGASGFRAAAGIG
ncbi:MULTISPECIES: type II toxin-antitoxin system VapC family toxin [Agrococcus]|uniref:type II toxin-antitoxin system VapC family toxin n=1 Tax=Agrococcus TaxID=46352 RepID=UPI00047D7F92|nr:MULTISPECIES: type II toxin-antitoxin system VapC family toxin [Agrococcus]QUW17805.1 type II toxin-antitoxin system VapC family toxin [Agrococcus sp. Marseille-Q4369]